MKSFLLAVSISLLSLLIISSPVGKPEFVAPPENPYRHYLSDTISSYFEHAINKGWIVGASVAILVGDSVWMLDGFGSRDVTTGDKIDAQTIFRIGSISKGFTAIVAGMMVEDGMIDWSTKLAANVPEFRVPSKRHMEEINLEHLLSQTSGLPYHSYTNLIEDGLSLTNIAGRFRSVRPISSPGAIYSYQNAMFAFSSLMMEKTTGYSFNEILQDRIFTPLGMNFASSTFNTISSSDNHAKPHFRRKGQWVSRKINSKYYNAVAAGGVNASAEDMAQWIQLLLGNRPDLISEEMLATVFKPRVRINDRNRYYQKWSNFDDTYYAMGWRVHTFQDPLTRKTDTMVHHGGYVSGYRGEIAVIPEEKIGISVMFNCPNRFAKNVVPFLLEQVRKTRDLNNTWQSTLDTQGQIAE